MIKYLVMQASHDYDDENFFEDGKNPIILFDTFEKANEKCKELNRKYILEEFWKEDNSWDENNFLYKLETLHDFYTPFTPDKYPSVKNKPRFLENVAVIYKEGRNWPFSIREISYEK